MTGNDSLRGILEDSARRTAASLARMMHPGKFLVASIRSTSGLSIGVREFFWSGDRWGDVKDAATYDTNEEADRAAVGLQLVERDKVEVVTP